MWTASGEVVGIKTSGFWLFIKNFLLSFKQKQNHSDEITLEHTKIRELLIDKPKVGDSGTDFVPTKIMNLHKKLSKERWIFLVRAGIDKGRQYIGLTEKIKIGRQSDNHIQLRDPKISRLHALILRKGSYLIIRDMQSTNGTKVNNERIYRPKRLFNGDIIELGDTIIEIILQKD